MMALFQPGVPVSQCDSTGVHKIKTQAYSSTSSCLKEYSTINTTSNSLLKFKYQVHALKFTLKAKVQWKQRILNGTEFDTVDDVNVQVQPRFVCFLKQTNFIFQRVRPWWDKNDQVKFTYCISRIHNLNPTGLTGICYKNNWHILNQG